MSQLNSPEKIGHTFYAAPPHCHAHRLEYIYNKVYGTIPTTLSFSEEFDKACLPSIGEHFSPVCSNLNKVGDSLIDEAIWEGKQGTVYAGMLLNTTYKTEEGSRVVYDSAHALNVLSFTDAALIDNKVDNLHVAVRAVCADTAQAQQLVALMEPFKLKQKSKIYILASEYGDLAFTALPIPTTQMDLALNYGDSFLKVHDNLVDNLNNTTSGLYLFYGEPGTGKSSYIKYLLSAGIDRKMAYIPVGLIDKLTHPDMLPLLMNNKNIILILEDAEKALLSREVSQDSAIVSTILNLTDGFIGQAINISIVATFNTEKDKIDEALLRKGRLRMSHEFKKIPVSNCKKIALSLGIDPAKITEDMTLAEIYNFDGDTGYVAPVEGRIGFC